MWLQVNPKSTVPIYQQIVDAVKIAIAKGVLRPGERIPSIRESAVELMLNHNTVAKAYRELEHDGVIVTFRGRGTFVTESTFIPDKEKRIDDLKALLKRVLIESHSLQISENELFNILREVMKQWNEDSQNDGSN